MSFLENAAFLTFLLAICYVFYRAVRYDDKREEFKPPKFALHARKKPDSEPSEDREGPQA